MKLNFFPITPMGSDCTQAFRVELDGEYTVGDLIDHVLTIRKNEWGYVNVGYYIIEYKYGKIVDGEDIVPNVKDVKIGKLIATGGWSRMDYLVNILSN